MNGFFSRGAVTALLGWGLSVFGRVDVLVPGAGELAGTLVARGWDPVRASAKARAAAGNTRNRVGRALSDLGVGAGDVTVFSWDDLAGNVGYERLRGEVESLYTGDRQFGEECMLAVAAVVGGAEADRSRREAALPFLFAELPLVLDTPAILGVGSSLFCYPRPMPMVDRLYAGTLPVAPSPRQGFLVTRLT